MFSSPTGKNTVPIFHALCVKDQPMPPVFQPLQAKFSGSLLYSSTHYDSFCF